MRRALLPVAAVLLVAAGLATATLGVSSTPHPTAVQPAPIRAIFYYPWFPNAWKQMGIYPFTKYKPTLGYYDGNSSSVIRKQVGWMHDSGLDAMIVSWFGPGTNTDLKVPTILSTVKGGPMKVALYYEIGQGLPSASKMLSDLDYAYSKYARHPNFLWVNGKPVLFVYNSSSDGANCQAVTKLKQASGGRFYLNLKVFAGFQTCADQPESWHQYAPAQPVEQIRGYSYAISPGFNKITEPSARLPRDLARWRTVAKAMVLSDENWQLVTTFNEWGEGTAVEPSSQWSFRYLNALRDAIRPSTKPPVTTTVKTTTAHTTTAQTTTVAPPPTTTAPPPSSGDKTIVAAGDIACDPSSNTSAPQRCDQGGTASLIRSIHPDAVLTLGDDQYEVNALSAYQSVFAHSWGDAAQAVSAPIRPAIGNHEYLTPGASGYCSYFGSSVCGGTTATKGYYSYDVGAWHLVSLNSECSHIGGCSAGSPEETWLRADLAAHPAACTLAYWHEPRFSAGQHGDAQQMATVWNDLAAAHADVVLSGHNHDYERFDLAGVTPAGQTDPSLSPTGVREFVVGTGGKNHYAISSAPLLGEQVTNDKTFGVLRLTLHAASYDWRFTPDPASGSFTDSGSTSCH